MSKTSPTDFEAMKARLIANGGSVDAPKRSASECLQVISSKQNTHGIIDAGAPKKKKPRMNATETELKRILDGGDFVKVEFEGMTLTLAQGARFTPDFYCLNRGWRYGAHITFYEAKGPIIREAALVRIKVAARMYPEFRFVLAQRASKKNGWRWTETVIES